MGLINCPDCGQPVSDRAKACIHCGCPLNEETLSAAKTEPEVKAPAAEAPAAQTPVEQAKTVQTPVAEKAAPAKEEKVDTTAFVEYLKQAKDLESSVYSQKNTVDLAKSNLKLRLPDKPKAPQFQSRISKPYEPYYSEPKKDYLNTIVFGILFFIGLTFVWATIVDDEPSEIIFAIIWFIPAAIFLLRHLNKKSENKKYEISYQNEMRNYEKNLKLYEEQEKEKIEFENDAKRQQQQINFEYETKCNIANNNYKIAQNALSDMNGELSETEETLNKLYSKDIIFAKYRNMVAICSFYEYFMSGRVNTLEGPNGAYNLYESELRQNLIINRLETISSQLENIKNNQFTLYTEIKNGNEIAEEMNRKLLSISNATSLISGYSEITAYCSAITASNTESLRYIETANLLLN